VSEEQPFDGIRVAEFGQFVAVPFCGQMLADGGAQVIKIEAPGGDPTRALNPLTPGETRTFISRNRGKHSLPLRLSDSGARPVIERILEWADVILINFRPGLDKKLGLEPEALLAAHPRLIIASVTAFGKSGPDAGLPGMDIVLQARSGLMAANGRTIDGRPTAGDPVSADYMCAMCLSFGVASALLRRERTGRGGIVDVSLMHAAMVIANNQLIRSEDQDGPVHERALTTLAQQRADGASWEEQAASIPQTRAPAMGAVYFRTYQTADRTIAVACGSHSLRVKFAALLGIDDPGLLEVSLHGERWEIHYAKMKEQVETMIRQAGAQTWIERLNDAGIPVAAVRFPVELFDDPHPHANGMFHDMKHPSAGTVRMVGPPVSLDGPGFVPAAPTQTLGSETDRILTDLGFAASDIDALVDAKVVRRSTR
jgi:CoA:oxalate CoA-transferase